MKGMLFTFEGIDGCGKSTTIPLVAEALRSEGYDVVESCEPTKTEFGMKICELLFNSGDIADLTTFFLFLADRAEHIAKTVAPAIEAGKVVLCDRFDLSTMVYQGLVGKNPSKIIRDKTHAAWLSLQGLDMTRVRRILFGCPPEVAYERILKRGALNKYDEASIEKLNKLREDYEYLADELREFDEVIVTVASQKIVVAATVTSILAKLQREGL